MKKFFEVQKLNRILGASLFVAATLIPGWAHASYSESSMAESEVTEAEMILENGATTKIPVCSRCIVKLDGHIEQCGIKGAVVCLQTIYE